MASFALVSGCAPGYITLGDRAMRSGAYQNALSHYQVALAENPSDVEAQRRVGFAHLKLGENDQAIDVLTNVIASDPRDGQAILYLGLAYEAEGRVDDAIEQYRKYPAAGQSGAIRKRLHHLLWQRNQEWARGQVQFETGLGSPDPNTLGVLPFELNDPTGELDGLGDALAGQVITDLSRIRNLRLVERLRLDAILRELTLVESGAVDPTTAPRVGKLIGAGRLVGGNIMSLGDDERLRVDLGLTDVQSGEIQPVAGEGTLDDLFQLEARLVFEILDAIGVQPSDLEREQIQRIPTRSLAAFLAYGKGVEAERAGRRDEAYQAFQEARRLDPKFDPAQDGLNELGGQPGFGSPTPVDDLIASLPPESELSVASDATMIYLSGAAAGSGGGELSDVLGEVLDPGGIDAVPERPDDDTRIPPNTPVTAIGEPPKPQDRNR